MFAEVFDQFQRLGERTEPLLSLAGKAICLGQKVEEKRHAQLRSRGSVSDDTLVYLRDSLFGLPLG